MISILRFDQVADDAIEAEVDTDAIDGEIRGEIADNVDAEAADFDFDFVFLTNGGHCDDDSDG